MHLGTAIISGKRGQFVLTDGNDEEHLSKGVYDTYTKTNLRYSQVRSQGSLEYICRRYFISGFMCMYDTQVAPLDMFKEVNTKTNLPAQIDLYATSGAQYDFQFIAKGMPIVVRLLCACIHACMAVFELRTVLESCTIQACTSCMYGCK